MPTLADYMMQRDQTQDRSSRYSLEADKGAPVPEWATRLGRAAAGGADYLANSLLNPNSKMDILRLIDQNPQIANWITMNLTPPGQMIQGSMDVSEAIQSDAPWQDRLAQGAAGVLGMATAPLGVDTRLAGTAARGLNRLDELARSGELMRPLQNEYGVFVGPGAKGWDALPGKFSSLADRMERAEIDDSGARLIVDADKMSRVRNPKFLKEVLDHPKLFEAYPDLENTVVGKKDGYESVYTPMGGRWKGVDTPDSIKIGKDVKNRGTFVKENDGYRLLSPDESYISALLHEITHGIQNREGFSHGGMPGFGGLSGYGDYQRLAGEIEARDVASRANLTPEQRATTPPYSSEDIPLSDWIVKGGNGPAMSIDDPHLKNAPWRQGQIEGYVDDPVERQKNFDKWFGDSKVVDENGKPLTVYHGTKKEFDQFKPHYSPKEQLGFGVHFTEDPSFAGDLYADGKGGRVLPVNLNLRNMLDADSIVTEGTDEYELAKKLAGSRFFPQTGEDGKKVAYLQNSIDATSPKRAEKLIRESGYDGIKYNAKSFVRGVGTMENVRGAKSYVAFEPNQIKSVFNRGTYDPKDPRILYGALPLAGMQMQQDDDPVMANAPWRQQ